MASPNYNIVSYLDQRGWCLERNTDDLAKYSKKLNYVKVLYGEKVPPADLTLVWNWPYLQSLNLKSKVTTFLLDHWSIDFYQQQGLDFFKLVNHTANYLVVSNDELWRRVIPHMKIPVFKLSAGVDTTYFKSQPLPKKLIFGWCGNPKASLTDDDLKGQKTIKKVCQKLDVHYIELGYENRVALDKIVESYYRKISVHICFSASEGDGLPVRESLCCGRPVITTPVGSVSNMVSHQLNGLIVSRDSMELADGIRYFVKNPHEIRRMSRNCKVVTKTESWKTKAPHWEAAFRMMIENK